MANLRRSVQWLVIAACLLGMATSTGCLNASREVHHGDASNKDVAVDIAREHARQNDRMAPQLDDTVAIISDRGDAWDIAFVSRAVFDSDEITKGGEPHVVVVKADGEIRDSYMTR